MDEVSQCPVCGALPRLEYEPGGYDESASLDAVCDCRIYHIGYSYSENTQRSLGLSLYDAHSFQELVAQWQKECERRKLPENNRDVLQTHPLSDEEVKNLDSDLALLKQIREAAGKVSDPRLVRSLGYTINRAEKDAIGIRNLVEVKDG